MLATILIVVMILLQTGALSLGLMVDRRFITAAASLNRKSAHSTIHNRERPKGAGLGNKEVLMPLVQLVLVLIVVGVLLGLINRYIPMAGSIKSILNGVVVIAVVLWLLNVFGLMSRSPRSMWESCLGSARTVHSCGESRQLPPS